MEEKQRRGKDQIEVAPYDIILCFKTVDFRGFFFVCSNFVELFQAVEFHVGKLQSELGECVIRRGALERMLAQKELQLLESQEQREALRAERDGLSGELQHLKTEHYSALKEAQRQTQRITVSGQSHLVIENSCPRPPGRGPLPGREPSTIWHGTAKKE